MNPVALISSVGRRSQLIGCARESFRALNLIGSVLGVDCSATAPGAHLVDQFFLVPCCDGPEFLPRLLSICEENRVTLLIPTIDTELGFYAAHREDFAAIGTTVAISSPETVEICADKVATYQWLVENGFPAVRLTTPESMLLDGQAWTYPLVVKPRRGSASIGFAKVATQKMLHALSRESTDLIVQEYMHGHEHTINVLVDRRGRCVCAVPHLRLEVRAGEVSKGATFKHRGLMELASQIAERLPGAYGPLNIQCFLGPTGTLQVTEINARIGGGYPLAHHAGADFPKWMLEELLQLPSSVSPDQWEDGLTMLRYDDAVFLPKRSVANREKLTMRGAALVESRCSVKSPNKTSSELAIDGGEPVRGKLFNPWPYFESDEIEAAAAVLRSGKINYWTGTEGREFEKEFAAFTGCKHGVAVANGTVALELALYALGIGLGDEVIVPSRTFIASASCAVMRGATPIIADVDANSQTLSAETIRPLLSSRTKAIIVVHLAGWPCDMDPIVELARDHGIKIVEDCAQAHGATYKERPVGSLGDVAAFSFCHDKIMSTGGEGGIVTTNDEQVWARAWSFKDHGKSYDAVYNRQHLPEFRWLHESFGTNWRLTGMQSAMGRVLLRKLPRSVEIRRRNASILTRGFSGSPALRVTLPPKEVGHSYYKYYVFLRPERLREGWDWGRIKSAINAEGIPCFSGICSEIYLERAFTEELRPREQMRVARELGETSLMFLVHPTLSEKDMLDTCNAVEKVMNAAAE